MCPFRGARTGTRTARSGRCRYAASRSGSARSGCERSHLLPFNRGGRLRSDIVHHAIDAANFVGDTAGHAREETGIETRPVGGHAIMRLDRANRDDAFIAAPIAHHADRLERQQYGKCLPQIPAYTGCRKFLHHDRIGAAQQLDAFARDLAHDTHRQPRSRKWLAVDDLARQTELAAQLADLVFEQLAQWFDQFELHPIGQAADIMMALDDRRRPLERHRLDDIGIESALSQKSRAAHDVLGFEHIDECMPDDAALLLGIEDVLQSLEKHLGCVADPEIDAKLAGENIFHPLALARTQQTSVDEYALEALADRAMNQSRGDRRIDAARQPEQHLVVRADLLANLADLGLDEIRHRPVAALAAYLQHEVTQHLRAARRMHNLRMKLDAANSAIQTAHRCAWCIGGMRDRSQRRRKRLYAIAMTHPDTMLLSFEAFEQRVLRVDLQRRGAVLLRLRGWSLRAQMRRDDIHAVADAENRRVDLEHLGIEVGRVLFIETRRPARQDDAARLHRANFRERKIERMNFAIHVRLAHPSRD